MLSKFDAEFFPFFFIHFVGFLAHHIGKNPNGNEITTLKFRMT